MVSVGAQYSGRLCGPGHDGARTTASTFMHNVRPLHALSGNCKPRLYQVRCKGAQWHRIGHGEKHTTGRLLPHEQGGGLRSERRSPGRRDHRGAMRTVARAMEQAGTPPDRVRRGSEGQRIPAHFLPFSSVTLNLPPSLQPQVAYTQTLLRDGRTCLKATIPELVWEDAQEDVIGEMAKALEPAFAKAGGLSPDELLDRAGGPGVIQKLAVERLMSQALRQVCNAGGGWSFGMPSPESAFSAPVVHRPRHPPMELSFGSQQPSPQTTIGSLVESCEASQSCWTSGTCRAGVSSWSWRLRRIPRSPGANPTRKST